LDWWESGPLNYVYTFSEREFKKFAQGYGLSSFGICQINDFYDEAWASEPATDDQEGFKKIREQILLHDKLCEVSGIPKSRVHGLFFKETPSTTTVEALRDEYEIFVTITRTRYLPIRWPMRNH